MGLPMFTAIANWLRLRKAPPAKQQPAAEPVVVEDADEGLDAQLVLMTKTCLSAAARNGNSGTGKALPSCNVKPCSIIRTVPSWRCWLPAPTSNWAT